MAPSIQQCHWERIENFGPVEVYTFPGDKSISITEKNLLNLLGGSAGYTSVQETPEYEIRKLGVSQELLDQIRSWHTGVSPGYWKFSTYYTGIQAVGVEQVLGRRVYMVWASEITKTADGSKFLRNVRLYELICPPGEVISPAAFRNKIAKYLLGAVGIGLAAWLIFRKRGKK